jgi:hypothetical protein
MVVLSKLQDGTIRTGSQPFTNFKDTAVLEAVTENPA